MTGANADRVQIVDTPDGLVLTNTWGRIALDGDDVATLVEFLAASEPYSEWVAEAVADPAVAP